MRHDCRYLLHDTKTHERRTVPLARTVVEALRRQRRLQAEERLAAGAEWKRTTAWVRADDDERELDLIFTRDLGRPWTQQALYKRLAPVCAEADIPQSERLPVVRAECARHALAKLAAVVMLLTATQAAVDRVQRRGA